MRRRCRIWWPKQLSSTEPSSFAHLFGWFVSRSSASLDIVVAFVRDELSQSRLEEITHGTNGNMPVFLQEKSTFSYLGLCTWCPISNGVDGSALEKQGVIRESTGKWICGGCGCYKVDGELEQCTQFSSERSFWVHLVYDSHGNYGKDIRWIPNLHHIHWKRQLISQCDVHVIVYDTPKYGRHHFSLRSWDSSEEVKSSLRKPKWIDELNQRKPLNDLDAVMLAINCACAAKVVFERHLGANKSSAKQSVISKVIAFTVKLLAICVASLSTLYYIFLQIFSKILSLTSHTWIYIMSERIFGNTWINFRIRCGQILHWPLNLQDNDLRSRSCVEYAERAAFHKHSAWSSLVVDVLLGTWIGLALLFHAESANLWVLKISSDATNELLRTGCVWLMGVPAGFKLNTELAGVLGMISLNAIQIWSTLWLFVDSLLIDFIKGLAILGILFGATIPAALVIDMILLATLHVSTLHRVISLLYSQQIQALAALWRLFRGQKWNPLRQRLDSYDYTVKQHIVGSLLFTPLLLLLPTTSVFYIYFTILNTTINVTCMLIELAISVIHGTPYIKIVLWLLSPRRFPCGIWFEIVSYHRSCISSPEIVSLDETGSPSENARRKEDIGGRSGGLVSVICSNFLSIGQIVLPHYTEVFSGVSGSALATSAYGILTGKRISSALGFNLPSRMPWMFIPWKEYWCLCRDSILACMADHECHTCQ